MTCPRTAVEWLIWDSRASVCDPVNASLQPQSRRIPATKQECWGQARTGSRGMLPACVLMVSQMEDGDVLTPLPPIPIHSPPHGCWRCWLWNDAVPGGLGQRGRAAHKGLQVRTGSSSVNFLQQLNTSTRRYLSHLYCFRLCPRLVLLDF